MSSSPGRSARAAPFIHVVVRFQDHVVLEQHGDVLEAKDGHGVPIDLGPFLGLVSQVGGRAFQSYPRIARSFRSRGIKSATGIDRYVDVTLPPGPDAWVDSILQGLMHLHDLVVFALRPWPYVPASPDGGDPRRVDQGHLKPRQKGGVGAECAWRVDGGDGCGVVVCLCDVALKSHEDLPVPVRTFGTPPDPPVGPEFDHANAALGVVAASKDNGIGVTGISPGAEIWFASNYGYQDVVPPDPGEYTWKPFDTAVLDCIYEAMTGGGIVIFEMQAQVTTDEGAAFSAPVEINPQVRAWIREAALNAGIVSVVPAGTLGQTTDLAKILSPYIPPDGSPEAWEWRAVWDGLSEQNPNHSLGVIVGGGEPLSRTAIPTTNYGTRVDCQGWGAQVVTTGGPGYQDYKTDFNGSSSATAIVGGVAAALQGAHLKAYGSPLHPMTVRRLLKDPVLGRSQTLEDQESKPIGPLPDLAAILRRLLILADLYLRDSLLDSGSTPGSTVKWFQSPDIIVAPAGKYDAGDLPFWEERLYEDLDSEYVVGAANEVFVRVHNRSMNPGQATVRVHWTEPGLFLDPGVWKPVGPSEVVDVPEFGDRVVRIPWTATDGPQPGKFCLIATLDSECDSLGLKGEFSSFTDYKRFLHQSNNIAHRNVQAATLNLGENSAMFSFFMRGIPHQEDWEQDQGFFRLEIRGRVPKGTGLVLRPLRPLPGIPGGPADGSWTATAPAPLIVKQIRLPAGATIPLSLEVVIPGVPGRARYDLQVDQYHDNDHLGRMNLVIVYSRRG